MRAWKRGKSPATWKFKHSKGFELHIWQWTDLESFVSNFFSLRKDVERKCWKVVKRKSMTWKKVESEKVYCRITMNFARVLWSKFSLMIWKLHNVDDFSWVEIDEKNIMTRGVKKEKVEIILVGLCDKQIWTIFQWNLQAKRKSAYFVEMSKPKSSQTCNFAQRFFSVMRNKQ